MWKGLIAPPKHLTRKGRQCTTLSKVGVQLTELPLLVHALLQSVPYEALSEASCAGAVNYAACSFGLGPLTRTGLVYRVF